MEPSAPPYTEHHLPSYESSAYSLEKNTPEAKLEKFKHLVQKHEISERMAGKLRRLEEFDIVLICDDSGSMNQPCSQPSSNHTSREPWFAPRQTRWDELRETIKVVVEIATTLDQDGVDLFFLNRLPIRNVTQPEEIERAFQDTPSGYTPLARVLREVLNAKRGVLEGHREHRKKVLILIATDGEPTDERGNPDRTTVRHILQKERIPRGSVHVSFVACTDDSAVMDVLNEWDRSLHDLDVVDDYHSERAEVLAAQGVAFPFSRGDWVCKILLGSVDPDIDNLDERKGLLPLRDGGIFADVVTVVLALLLGLYLLWFFM